MTVTLIMWRDIPSQLVKKQGRKSEKLMLSNRFQEAIDRAAMREGVHDSDGYLEGWHRETLPTGEEEVDDKLVNTGQMFEDKYDEDALSDLVKNGGWVRR